MTFRLPVARDTVLYNTVHELLYIYYRTVLRASLPWQWVVPEQRQTQTECSKKVSDETGKLLTMQYMEGWGKQDTVQHSTVQYLVYARS